MKELTTLDPDFSQQLDDLLREVHEENLPTEAVASILREVKERGEEAVLEYTRQFDRVRMSAGSLRVDPEKLKSAAQNLSPEIKDSLEESRRCVEHFHQACQPRNWTQKNPHGAVVGERFYPLRRVGLYIPGGNVPLVSTILMSACLARLAKVPEIAVFTPPGPEGEPQATLLGALGFLGIQEVYAIGGVQAMGVMAYGSEGIAPVEKIFGPGNAYVVEAKRQLFGVVGIDLLPGPSEVMVIADDEARPDWVAADLLSQAEHGPGGIIFLVCASAEFRAQVATQIKRQLPSRRHRQTIETVLEKGFFGIVAPSPGEMALVANRIAPEHLELQVETKTARLLEKEITTAGAMLSGVWTPTAVGDFTAGPSHVLPTGSAGIYSSGLRIEDFYRRSSYVRYDEKSLAKAMPVTDSFSSMEDLDAHGFSVQIRFDDQLDIRSAE